LTGINSQPNTGAKTLVEISLLDCQKLTDESLKHISEGLPNVNRINLSFCVSVTDTGLKSLSRLPSLRDLNLRSCDNVSDIGVGFFAEGSASTLRTLDVSFCDRVSDSEMAHVATGLASLTSLSMSSCHITDQGITRLAPYMKSLHTFNIGQCVKLTDRAVQTISQEIKTLRSIDLYGCTKISTEGLKVLNKCENLKVVNLGLWHPF
jgi:F-box/leucine-rich repeat protein 14